MPTRIGLRHRADDPQGPPRLVVDEDAGCFELLGVQHAPTLSAALTAENPSAFVARLERGDVIDGPWAVPLEAQEVWAAGVTYERSKAARIEESEAAADCYDHVYAAERPEIFFKALAHRCVGHEGEIRIRRDSKWNVPEPELTLCFDSSLQLKAFTIGNDVSSRDIEGENPLYLPQAKVYDGCCALGPVLTLCEPGFDASRLGIGLRVVREGSTVFAGDTSVARMVRSFAELGSWLGREASFPHGVYLMTGTGIVPDESFSLQPRDLVEITIESLGTLSNRVAAL